MIDHRLENIIWGMLNMAIRPVFIPKLNGDFLVQTKNIEFEWFAGMATSQKQKSIRSLHSSAKKIEDVERILEISSKSESTLGVALSAFNLMVTSSQGKSVSVECIFQSSKVFEGGIQYLDLLDVVNQFRFIELLKKISKEKGLTLIYVSHDIKVLSKICERIIVLKDGNIVEENDTIQILKEPKNDYTKLLIKAATAD